MTPREYFGLLYNIPTIQSLRVLETAAALALLFVPQEAEKYLTALNIKQRPQQLAKNVKGLRVFLTK